MRLVDNTNKNEWVRKEKVKSSGCLKRKRRAALLAGLSLRQEGGGVSQVVVQAVVVASALQVAGERAGG